MADAAFTLSAFGDEIAVDLAGQLQVLRDLRIHRLELRTAWGTNVLQLDDAQIAEARRLLAEYGITVSCLGSPIGKSPIADSLEREIENLQRAFMVGEALGSRLIRVFSFYPPDPSAGYDAYVSESAVRLARLAALAGERGFRLLLENEKGIITDTPARCHAVLQAVGSPHLGYAWDSGNFVQVGVRQPVTTAWPMLGPAISYVHIKDTTIGSVTMCLPGEGDGEVRALLAALRTAGYCGVLALEPHLAVAGRSGGFSGAEGMAKAVTALRREMAAAGCREV